MELEVSVIKYFDYFWIIVIRNGYWILKKDSRESFYSLLNANTGSFLAACLDGINPLNNVRTTLNTTNVIAAGVGNTALISGLSATA